jgi:hypothetical protein
MSMAYSILEGATLPGALRKGLGMTEADQRGTVSGKRAGGCISLQMHAFRVRSSAADRRAAADAHAGV